MTSLAGPDQRIVCPQNPSGDLRGKIVDFKVLYHITILVPLTKRRDMLPNVERSPTGGCVEQSYF